MSITPFTKWYIKGYSLFAANKKILKAIDKKDISKLNKNLKIIAKRITLRDNG
jgi:hypothetical protein